MMLTVPIVGNPTTTTALKLGLDPVFVALAIPSLAAAATARPWRTWRSDGSRHWVFLVLAAIGALPAVWYGVDRGFMQRNTFPPTADPHHNAHWWAMSVCAFMVVLVVSIAAISARGWQVAAVVAGLGAISVGAASVIAPQAASAVGVGWGSAAVAWASPRSG